MAEMLHCARSMARSIRKYAETGLLHRGIMPQAGGVILVLLCQETVKSSPARFRRHEAGCARGGIGGVDTGGNKHAHNGPRCIQASAIWMDEHVPIACGIAGSSSPL